MFMVFLKKRKEKSDVVYCYIILEGSFIVENEGQKLLQTQISAEEKW